jgi:hypothetical protein
MYLTKLEDAEAAQEAAFALRWISDGFDDRVAMVRGSGLELNFGLLARF